MFDTLKNIIIVIFIITVAFGLANFYSVDISKIYPPLIIGMVVAISTKLDAIEERLKDKN